jgi:hypothetical protein
MPPEDSSVTGTEDGRVLSPKELDIADDDSVTELEEGRYVISASSEPAAPRSANEGSTMNERVVHEWLTERVDDTDTRHGFDVTTKIDGSVARKRVGSDDVVEVFDALLAWYASRVSDDTAPEAVLGILLAESDHPIRYPSASLEASLAQYDCSPEDSIDELLDAVEDEGGMVLRGRTDTP